MSLPHGAPLELSWFLAWVALGLFLATVVGYLKDSDKTLHEDVRRAHESGLDVLNERLLQLVFKATGGGPRNRRSASQVAATGPVSDEDALEQLDRDVRRAWRPVYRYRVFTRACRFGTIFCMVHALTAIPAGAVWVMAQQDDRVTKIDLAVFSALLVPIAVVIFIQFSVHFVGSVGR